MKKSWLIDRRTMLRGLGVTLALPLLDVMGADLPAAKGRSGPPIRAAFLYTPNGAYMPSWTPKGETLSSPTLDVIERHHADINVLTGLSGPGGHQKGPSDWLTGCDPVEGQNLKLKQSDAISLDQYIAKCVGGQTYIDTLTLGLQATDTTVDSIKENDLNHALQRSISWSNSTTVAIKQIKPSEVFDGMFRSRQPRVPRWGTASTTTPKAIQGSKSEVAESRQKSVLDLAREATKRLEAGLGVEDSQKMEQYLESVRSLEKRLAFADSDSASNDVKTEASGGNSSELMKIGRPKEIDPESKQVNCKEFWTLMLDLMALAFQTDTTRSCTFMYANEGSGGIAYRSEGFNDSHHNYSHHGKTENDEKVQAIMKTNRLQIEMYGHFLDRLKSVKENGRPLLDNCLILQGSSLSNANIHAGNGLPLVLAGKAGGKIKTGRHLIFDKREMFWEKKVSGTIPFSNALVSIAKLMDLPERKFGNSTGALTL